MSKHRAAHSRPRSSLRVPHVGGRSLVVGAGVLFVSATVVLTGLGIAAATQTPTEPEVVAPPPIELPDPVVVPEEPVETLAPAAVLATEEAPAGLASVERTVLLPPEQTVEEIPDQARAAYQRAEAVLVEAAPTCGLEWTVLAAVGRVESDHGQVDGGVLDDDGVATPAVLGERLNGKREKEKVRDTDGGKLDGDDRWDRTVGALRLLPSTWNVVGVDADDDGLRNPQDIDDAALALGVYLCATERELGKKGSLAEALAQYNPAPGYAKNVGRIAASYAADEQAMEDLADDPVVVKEVAPEEPVDEDDQKQDDAKQDDKDDEKDDQKDKDEDEEQEATGVLGGLDGGGKD